MKIITDKQERINFFQLHFNWTNKKLCERFGFSISAFEKFTQRNNIKRPLDIVTKKRLTASKKGAKIVSELNKERIGDKNPNWKNGISKNNYHYKKIQMIRYPERILARRKVHNAVKSGKLTRLPCETCKKKPSFAHHEDYSKPLEVKWLCRKHHREKHIKH